MYTCPACKQFESPVPGKCIECNAVLQASSLSQSGSQPWPRRQTIDEKEKTGDQDQFSFMWVAHECIYAESQGVGTESFEKERKKFARQYGRAPTESDGDVNKKVFETRTFLEHLNEKLGDKYQQFLVNLAMLGYRTAGGGRARKVSNWMRARESGGIAQDSYIRPFHVPPPYVVGQLLKEIPPKPLTFNLTDTVNFQESTFPQRYIPPSRFTATFPLLLKDSYEPTTVRTLVDPRRKEETREPDSQIKYSFMGSFGFSEPSYSAWTAEGGEYAGTRLSLGAYSLNETYLTHLLQLVKQTLAKTEQEPRKGYKGFGGVRPLHLEQLLEVARRSGHKLAIEWTLQMIEIANALVHTARKKVKKDSQEGLAAFFGFVQGKISRAATKLSVLKQNPKDLTCFEYIWVLESSLWELAFLGATCLTADEIRGTLQKIPELESHWKRSVGCSEASLQDTLQNVPTGGFPCTFHRIYAPTGMAAGQRLCEALEELDFQIHAPVHGKDNLDPFIPYFEFYQEYFLSEERKLDSAQGVQVWVNLSDYLHAKILKRNTQPLKLGEEIATLLMEYVDKQALKGLQNKIVVVDFTKFGSEMPNSLLYPILAQLALALVSKHQIQSVVFLRSNLKYNTGPLDRYQSGELLVYNQGPGNLLQALAKKMKEAFQKGMDPDGNPDAKDWGLNGEYVSLMKKVYLLSDAISSWRWAKYAAEW